MRLKQFLGNIATFGELGRLQETNARMGRNIGAALAEYDRELERAKQDAAQGWVKIEGGRAQTNLDTIRANCRQMYQYTDPMVKGAVNSYTKFCFQQGIDGPSSENEPTQAALTAFWGAQDNQQTFYSTVAQYRRSTQLLLDGSLFVMLRLKPGNKDVAVRYLPTDYVEDIITDPLDGTRVLYYKAMIPQLAWSDSEAQWGQADEKTKTVFYRDLFNTDAANDPLEGRLENVEKDCWVQHVAINAVDDAQFGIPEPATSVFWFEQHKKLAEDQATLSRVRASIATQLKVVGTATQVADMRTTIEGRSQNTATTDQENLSGQFNVLNQFADLELKAFGTGSADAWTNSRIFRIKALAGMGGLPLHFLSDPENANLATALSMERPALETFRAYQAIWVDAYRKQCDFALVRAGIVEPLYDIPVPRILAPDLPSIGGVINDSYELGLLTQRQASSWLLDFLGFDDVAEELAALETEKTEPAETTKPAELLEEESEWE